MSMSCQMGMHAKTFNHLSQLDIPGYGEEVTIKKEECVNHVVKRLGTALRKLVTEQKAKGVTLGGKGAGQLTLAKIDKLTAYYGKAVRQNNTTVDDMKTGIMASFLHCISSDEDPHHSRCPAGTSSWCFYNRATAQGRNPELHKQKLGTYINREVGRLILPIYERLSDSSLLERRLSGTAMNRFIQLSGIYVQKLDFQQSQGGSVCQQSCF